MRLQASQDAVLAMCGVCGNAFAHSHMRTNPRLLVVRTGRVRVCDANVRTWVSQTRRDPGVCECATCAPPIGGVAASHTPAALAPRVSAPWLD
jgi:hypothetical protein